MEKATVVTERQCVIDTEKMIWKGISKSTRRKIKLRERAT
jgi:hypothetical protein